MTAATLLTWAPLGGVLVYVMLIFNRLVKGRNSALHARASIDVYLKRRHQLIPALVESVAGYTVHERQTLERITIARAQAVAQLGKNESAIREQDLGTELQTLQARVEDYPDLQADSVFINLQKNLTEAEEQISAARRAYNGLTMQQNNLVQMFPSFLVARLFGFIDLPFYAADTGAQTAPGVKLSIQRS